MKFNPDMHHRKTVRLKHYDYADAGGYFITICTQNRECLFGEIEGGKMVLNNIGEIVKKCWDEIPAHYPNVILDAYVIMPNHVHGIIIINHIVGAQFIAPNVAPDRTNAVLNQGVINHAPTIGDIVRAFKSRCTYAINQTRNTPGFPVWQRNYYEHIIRNENELNQITTPFPSFARRGLRGGGNNPMQWDLDNENPQNSRGDFIRIERAVNQRKED